MIGFLLEIRFLTVNLLIMAKCRWTRGEKIAMSALIISIIGVCGTYLDIPTISRRVGLDVSPSAQGEWNFDATKQRTNPPSIMVPNVSEGPPTATQFVNVAESAESRQLSLPIASAMGTIPQSEEDVPILVTNENHSAQSITNYLLTIQNDSDRYRVWYSLKIDGKWEPDDYLDPRTWLNFKLYARSIEIRFDSSAVWQGQDTYRRINGFPVIGRVVVDADWNEAIHYSFYLNRFGQFKLGYTPDAMLIRSDNR